MWRLDWTFRSWRSILAINLKNGIVASYFSVIETDSGTDENYKRDMINMLDEIVNKNL